MATERAIRRAGQRLTQCGAKYRFETWAAANRVARIMNRNDDRGKVTPYHCPHCGRVHVGNDSPKPIPLSATTRSRQSPRQERKAARAALRTWEGE